MNGDFSLAARHAAGCHGLRDGIDRIAGLDRHFEFSLRGIAVVFEGLEESRQLEIAEEVGAHMVQGFVLAMALLFVALNLAIDIVYTLVDPRLRLED